MTTSITARLHGILHCHFSDVDEYFATWKSLKIGEQPDSTSQFPGRDTNTNPLNTGQGCS